MLAGVLDPTHQLLARCHRTGRIVGETKVNKIDMFLWRLGNKTVFRGAGQINDAFVAAVLLRGAGVTGHHVCIDVDRINWIGNGNFVLIAKNIEDVAAIAFRSVRDKNFVVRDVDLAIAIIFLSDCRS